MILNLPFHWDQKISCYEDLFKNVNTKHCMYSRHGQILQFKKTYQKFFNHTKLHKKDIIFFT